MTSPISSTSSTTATPVNTSYQPKPLVVPNTSSGALSSLATSLASQSAIVASLGGSTSGVSVYSPSGLLNSLIQAGADTSSADGGTAATGDSGTTTGTGCDRHRHRRYHGFDRHHRQHGHRRDAADGPAARGLGHHRFDIELILRPDRGLDRHIGELVHHPQDQSLPGRHRHFLVI